MLGFKRRSSGIAAAAPRTIKVGGHDYALYIRRHPRSRSISLRTDCAAQAIRVTSAPHVPLRQITAFIHEKSDWIASSFARAGPPLILAPDAVIALHGHDVTIMWNADWPRRVQRADGSLRVGGPREKAGARIQAWLKQEARRVMTADIADYASLAGIASPPLALSNARRRWGSCSSAGHIRINWRLIMAPQHVRRSVVAHEIAHVRHMDHSSAFYAWLDSLYEGNRASADRWLKQHGGGLHSVVAE